MCVMLLCSFFSAVCMFALVWGNKVHQTFEQIVLSDNKFRYRHGKTEPGYIRAGTN